MPLICFELIGFISGYEECIIYIQDLRNLYSDQML